MSGYRSIFFGAIALGSVVFSEVSPAIETEGYFCSNCVDAESARQQAIQYVAPLVCNSSEVLIDPTTELVCRSEERRIVLGNYLTRQIFAFRVFRSDTMPWETQAVPISLSGDEITGYNLIFEFREDLENTLRAGIDMTQTSASILGDDPSSCPQGTALDWVLKLGGIDDLEDTITAAISEGTESHAENAPWFLPSFGLGLNYKRLNFNLQWPGPGGSDQPVDSFELFYGPADETGLFDVLVFDIIEIRKSRFSHQALVDLELNRKLSRAEGHNLENLLTGDVVVTDPCVLEKLDQRDIFGGSELRVGGNPLNADGSVAGGGGGATPGGSASRMCVFDFFVNGVYQYSFTAPCDSFKEKEEIKP